MLMFPLKKYFNEQREWTTVIFAIGGDRRLGRFYGLLWPFNSFDARYVYDSLKIAFGQGKEDIFFNSRLPIWFCLFDLGGEVCFLTFCNRTFSL